MQGSQSQARYLAELSRTELARRLNKWEYAKQHFFLNSFLQLAKAHSHYYQAGGRIMDDMDEFMEDMRQSVSRIQLQEVGCKQLCDS